MTQKVKKSDSEWQQQLTPEQYRVARQKGTERAFTGTYHATKEPGVYTCVCCGTPFSVRPASSTPAPAGRVSPPPLPRRMWRRKATIASGCGAPKCFARRVTPTWAMCSMMGRARRGCVIVSTPALSSWSGLNNHYRSVLIHTTYQGRTIFMEKVTAKATFGAGCFWAWKPRSARSPAWLRQQSAMRAARLPTRPIMMFAPTAPATPRWSRLSMIPPAWPMRTCSPCSGRTTTRRS